MIEIIPNWHPFFVHFTVALVSVSVIFHLLARITAKQALREQWLVVARWTLWAGAAITVVTVIAGIYAYNTVAHDELSHVAMTTHRNWALVTATVIFLTAGWAWWIDRRRSTGPVFFLVALLFTGVWLAQPAGSARRPSIATGWE